MADLRNSDSVNQNCSPFWEPFKTLLSRVERALLRGEDKYLHELPDLIHKQRGSLLSLLQKPAKNAAHRDRVNNAETQGITVTGEATPLRPPKDICDDAIKLSDALDINELRALELIFRAEVQIPSFSNVSRLAVAATLFYDGQLSLISSLNLLLHSVQGRQWSGSIDPEIQAAINRTMTSMMQDEGLLMKLLTTLKEFNPLKTIDALQTGGVLNMPKRYQKDIVRMINEIEQKLSECVFYWCAQMTVTKDHFKTLYELLAEKCLTVGSGYLNKSGTMILMSVISCLDLSPLQEGSYSSLRCPLTLVEYPEIATMLDDLLKGPITFMVEGVKSIVQFALACAVNSFQLHPPNGNMPPCINKLIEEQESMVDKALKEDVFRNMVNLLGPSANIMHTDVFYMSTFHALLTSFIVEQPLKIKKIRLVADEVGRTTMSYQNDHGINPPSSPHDFENFLQFLSHLYIGADGTVPSFATHLIDEFWSPEVTGHSNRALSPRLVALYNFVILYKDYHHLLPFNMYVPYTQMLSTLCQSPRASSGCYTLLKSKLGPVTVSLEHIFNILSAVHQQLRSDVPLNNQVTLSAMEAAGLEAALKLIASIVRNSESARVTLVEQPAYNPLMLFVSLLGCSLPVALKAACVDCLSAFALFGDNALKIWQFIEAAKLVSVDSYMSSRYPGMPTDLEEVESRQGTYPVTIAFLKLLDILTDNPLPIIVGSRVFKNGFDPYMLYLRESVFLKFLNRTYANSVERWTVASLCLKIFEKILRKFSCVSDNVLFNNMTSMVVKPTSENGGQLAFNLLAHLLQNGQLLRLILKIIDEGIAVVDADEGIPERQELEQSILLCLKIVQLALIQQDNFLCEVRNSNAALIITSLDQLLMGTNPRTNKPDYTVTIARIVGYFATLPRQALAATRVIYLLTRTCKVAEHLARAFEMEKDVSLEILTGFAGSLDLTMYDDPQPGNEEAWTDGQIRTAIAQTILRMLQQCIELHGPPNVGHFFLGFNLKRSINKATLERPRVLSTPKNCLHTTLELLEIAKNFPGSISVSLVESCFKLIYTLCANQQTSEPVMRYLRTTDNFFYEHLTHFPMQDLRNTDISAARILLQQCWILKGLSLELRMTAEQHQRSMLKKLVDHLVVSEGTVEANMSRPIRRKLLTILDGIVNTPMPENKGNDLVHFNSSEVNALIKACQYKEGSTGPLLTDISALHDRLTMERLTEAANISGHMGSLTTEIGQILKMAVAENSVKQFQNARKLCLMAWREVTEVMVSTCQPNIFGGEIKMRFLLEITNELLTLICDERKVNDAVLALSEVILINMMSLSKLLIEASQCRATDSSSNGYIAVNAYAGQLLVIMRKVIDCLLKVTPQMQSAKANFYGSLLNILNIVKISPPAEDKKTIADRAMNDGEYQRLRRSHMELINSYGESFMEIVERDFCSGHTITRMLSLSTLNIILCIDSTQSWLEHLVKKGYLSHITESISEDDNEIQLLLTKGSADDKQLHLFTSKMSVLQRIAQTERGARMLLDCGLINKLTEFGSLQLRPVSAPSGQNWLSPSVYDCYQKIYHPIMQLLCAISSSVQLHNQDCLTQLQNFFLSHSDTSLIILQQRPEKDVSETILTEFACACKVVSRLGPHEDMYLGRIQKLHETMLNALPWAIGLKPADSLETLRLEIIEAILHSCVSFLIPTVFDRKACHLLFSPNLLSNESNYGQLSQASMSPLRLGLLVQALQEFCGQIQKVSDARKTKEQKLEKTHEMAVMELEELLPEDRRGTSMDIGVQRGIIKDLLSGEAGRLKKQMDLLSSIIEQCLFVMWRHLEFFLTQFVPIHETTLEQLTRNGSNGTLLSSGVANVTNEEVESLRASVANVFSDAYFRKILQVEGLIDGEPRKEKVVGSLVRRLKSLARAK